MAQGKTGSVTIDGVVDAGVQGKLKIDLNETYDQAANTSNLSITHVWLKINSYTGTYNGDMIIKINGVDAVTLNGNSLNNSVAAFSQNTWIEVKNLSGGAITGSVNNIAHDTDGTKTVSISIHKSHWSYPAFMDSGGFGYKFSNGASTNFTLTKIPRQYTLSISAGTGSSITVKRNGTTLSNGATITYGDSLVISFAASTGYDLDTHTVNGVTFTSGGTKTVDENVTVVSTASPIRSTISAPNGTFGSKLTITVTRYSTAYTHTITYSCAGDTGTLVTKSSSTSIRVTPSMSTVNRIPNATSAPCTFTCTTYNGSTVVGTHSITITLSVPASVAPSVSSGWASAGYTNSGTAAASVSAAIVGYSKLTVTLDVSKISLPYSATLSSVKITYNGTTRTRTTSGTETFAAIGSTTVTATLVITDSRGRTYSGTVSQTAYAYSAPSLSGASAYRCNSGGTADEEGSYYRAYAVMSYTTAGGAISAALTTRIKSSGGSYGSATAIQSGTASVLGGGLSYLTAYVVEIRATDSLGNAAVLTFPIPTAAVAFNIRDGGKGAAFGKYAEQDGLDVEWDATFRGVLDVVPRRCYGALSSAGWYRAGYIKDIVRGNRTYSLTIRIATQGADMHIITLVGAPSSQLSFCNEASKASVLSIDKIRVTNINGNGYIDVHYALSSGIYVRIDFDDWSAGVAGSNAYFTAESLQAVADAPSGETVISSYNFAANTNGDISSLITFNNATYARAVRRGNLVNISFQGNSRTWAESEYLCTLPSSLTPSIVHWPVGYLNGSPVALRIDTTGIQIWIQPPTPTGRLYFDCTYIIA